MLYKGAWYRQSWPRELSDPTWIGFHEQDIVPLLQRPRARMSPRAPPLRPLQVFAGELVERQVRSLRLRRVLSPLEGQTAQSSINVDASGLHILEDSRSRTLKALFLAEHAEHRARQRQSGERGRTGATRGPDRRALGRTLPLLAVDSHPSLGTCVWQCRSRTSGARRDTMCLVRSGARRGIVARLWRAAPDGDPPAR